MTDTAAVLAFVAVMAVCFAAVALIFGALVPTIVALTIAGISGWLSLEDPFA